MYVARGWLHHILQNVIANAVMMFIEVDKGGMVSVTASQKADKVEIDVEDSGPGVDESIRDTLFNEGVTNRTGGTGQGLHIARDLTKSSGGSIELAGRTSRLSGAHFRITLPAKKS